MMIEKVPVFKELTEKEKVSLEVKSNEAVHTGCAL